MINNLNALSLVKQVGKKSFFQQQAELFWLDYQKSDINRIGEKWDGRDSFKVYYSHSDILDPSKPGFIEFSLTRNLQRTIEGRFDVLVAELKDLLSRSKATSIDVYSDVFFELEVVEKEIGKLKLPGDYKNVIAQTFEQQMRLLRKRGNFNIRNKKKTWKFLYRPHIQEEEQRFDDDGRFQDFFELLKEEGFIRANTRKNQLQQLFSNEVPRRKIEWKKGPAELYTMVNMLEEKGFIKSYRKWSAIRESFITDFPMTNFHSTTPVTDKRKLEKISEIVDELLI